MRNSANICKGFTLVELAIVLIAIGLLLSAMLSLYRNYRVGVAQRVTIENAQAIQSVLFEYFGRRGCYPVPADPTLGPGDPGYGLAGPYRDYFGGQDYGGTGIVRIDPPGGPFGGRDADGPADLETDRDSILIGAVPFRTLFEDKQEVSFYENQGYDGYGFKFTYAVSEEMTGNRYAAAGACSNVTSVNQNAGAIAVLDEAGESLISPASSAHYVIFSHGPDGVGAYTRDGALVDNCLVPATMTPIPVGFNPGTTGISTERENCDNNDAVFVNGVRSLVDNDNYYDDYLFYQVAGATQLWAKALNTPSGGNYQRNLNFGGVGVGLEDADTALHVNGTVRAETEIRAETGYCDQTGGDCVRIPDLFGTNCPAGEAVVGISDSQIVCAPLFTTTMSFSCPNAGEFVQGFSNLGDVNCVAP